MMPLLVSYLFKLSVSIVIIFFFYQLVLRRLTFYNWNRFYLLLYTLASFSIPFIDVMPLLKKNEMAGNQLVRFIPSVGNFNNQIDAPVLPEKLNAGISWTSGDLLLFIFLCGIFILLIRLGIQLLSFKKIRNKAHLILEDNIKLYQVDQSIIPFSFGRSIFINRALHGQEELQEIIQHEFVHVRQLHTIDIIWSELFCVLNWYNPFAWIIRKAIRQNLEFIADNKVLQTGIDKKQYQYLLLKVTGNNHFSIASQFNFSSLKKRIAMMNKMKSARMHLVRFLFVLPLIAVLLVAFRKNNETTSARKTFSQPVVTKPETLSNDTVPGPDNYIIEMIVKEKKENSVVIVKDKISKKQVKRVSLAEWDKNKKQYENTYGSIDGIAEDKNPVFITTDDGKNVYKIRRDDKSNTVSDYIEISNDNKAKVTLDNGTIENYNLDNEVEKKEFEKKYGTEAPVNTPAKAGTATTITGRSASASSSPGKTIEQTSVTVSNDIGTTLTSPAVATSGLTGTRGIAESAEPVKTIIVEDNVIAIFKKDMAEADVKKIESDLKSKGYEFKINKADFNNGRLVLIKGHITKHRHKQYFNASEFSRLIITDSPGKNDEDHFNFLVEQGSLSVNDRPELQ